MKDLLRNALQMLFFLTISISLSAQDDCEDPVCHVNSLSMNTGVDHTTGTMYPVPANQNLSGLVRDPYWTTVQSPDTVINLGNPWVIPHVAVHWDNGNPTEARWLSPLRNTDYDINNPDVPFIFERCFCVCEEGEVELDFTVFGDDAISRIELGNTVLYSASAPLPSNFGTGMGVDIQATQVLEAGEHCLRIHLNNISGDRMGFKVEGDIAGPSLLNSACCAPRGEIAGFKFEDLNVNGIWDSGEPALQGWEINLSNGQSILTDIVGFYSFNNLQPGNYTVTETQQPGYTQTLPVNNQPYNVTLNAFQSLTLNFGNTTEEVIYGEIAGRKFHDLNCDGIKGPGEPFLAGWVFDLFSGNSNTPIQTAISDLNGFYSFNNLLAGTYTVRERTRTGWQQTYPANGAGYTVTLTEPVSFFFEFGNCLVDDPDACCDSEDEPVFHEDFEAGVNHTNEYSLGNVQIPGEFDYLDANQASSLSGGGWDVRGYNASGNCNPNDRFMAVNGRTGQSGEKRIYVSDLLPTEDDKEYSVCVQLKHLPQCAFDVVPVVRVEVLAAYGIGTPFPIFQSPNTTVVTSSNNCDYLTISGTFTGVSPSFIQGCFIRIYLDETGIGAGNDLAIDEVIVREIPKVAASQLQWTPDPTTITAGVSYSITATPDLPLGGDCTERWEVFEIADANDPYTPIPGTYMTGNANTTPAWGHVTNFPGYNSVAPSPGVFMEDKDYAIWRIVDCDCEEESRKHWKFLSGETEGSIFLQNDSGEGALEISLNKRVVGNSANDLSIPSGLTVQPNPFQSSFLLAFGETSKEEGIINIYNLAGQAIKTFNYPAGETELNLDLSTFPAGTYLIRMQLNGKLYSEKIIKQ